MFIKLEGQDDEDDYTSEPFEQLRENVIGLVPDYLHSPKNILKSRILDVIY